MSKLHLSCFGAFQVTLDGERLTSFHSVKVQALLAYLALEANRPHTREYLATLLWPLDAETSARNSLRQGIYELRKLLGDQDDLPTHFLLVTRQTVQFNQHSSYTLDVADFLAHIKQGSLEAAAALYRGELLSGLSCESEPFEEWLRQQRADLHNQTVDLYFRLADEALQRGDAAQARNFAHRELTLEPWREEAHRQLMTALALNNERSAALAQYESCRRLLAEELGVGPDAETTTLYEQIKAGKLRRGSTASYAPSLPGGLVGSSSLTPEASKQVIPTAVESEPLPRHNLPAQLTPFVGRKTDLVQLAARLRDPTCRLLTIVGPGGMGKTRLALQTAQQVLASEASPAAFADGIFFVALAGVGSPDLLVSTMATTLNFTFYGNGDPKSQLLEHLRSKSLLLVLDNFEHLLDGAELVTELLAAAPGVKVLATSREPLNLHEEWLYPLGGMSFPGDEGETSRGAVADLTEYTAVQLFVQCARRMQPTFDLTQEREAVVRICRLVGGMPLGIEMASSWLKHFTCTQIADEVERNLDFLATTLRNVPPRHRSMRAVFAHSWSLLSEAEQQVLQRLAVFRGGFRLAAAQPVAGASFPLLMSLAEKSLVQPTPSGRYHLHELLRQFAEEKLQADPAAHAQVQQRQCDYYIAFLAQQEAQIKGAEPVAAMEEFEAEIENVRIAWLWAVTQGDLSALESGLESLYEFHYIKCWYRQGHVLFKQAAEALGAHPATAQQQIVHAKLTTKQGLLQLSIAYAATQQPNELETSAIFEQNLLLFQRSGETAATSGVYLGMARIAESLGDYRRSYTLRQTALSVCEANDDTWGAARMLESLCLMAHSLGDYAAAKRWAQQGIDLCQQRQCQMWLGEILNNLGETHRALGEYAEGVRVVQAALAARTAMRNKRGIAWSLKLLGQLAWCMGDYTTAQTYAQQSSTLFQALGLTGEQKAALNTLGDTACSLGEYQQAKHYFCTVLDASLRTGTLTRYWTVADALVGLAKVLQHEDRKEQAAEVLHHVLRHPRAWQETKERAATLLGELPAEIIATAQAADRDLDTVVAQLLAEPQGISS
jgi:predicted ATPase/DNA-binding SARP family transcriptional activator